MGIRPEDFAKIEARLNAKGHGVITVRPGVNHGKTSAPVTSNGLAAKLAVRPSTDEERLNKTEAAFLARLRSEPRWAFIGIQNVTLKLADDTRYTPDFVCVGHGGELIAYEVKGFWRDDARVKIKVAARLFPFLQFIAVTRTKGGVWNEEVFKP